MSGEPLQYVSIGGDSSHRKTGGVYQVLCHAIIKATMTNAIVYAARGKDGRVQSWIQPTAEFCDGSFEPADMTPTDQH